MAEHYAPLAQVALAPLAAQAFGDDANAVMDDNPGATLDKLEADLNAYGTKTKRITAGEMLQTGERVRFEVPSGHIMELYAEKVP